MEQKNKWLLTILITLVIFLAVFASFGMGLFRSGTPEIVLPTLTPNGGGDPGGATVGEDAPFVLVDVTPDTVQSVIATMERWPSYSRTITLEVAAGEEEMRTFRAQVWVDGGWTRVDMTSPVQGLSIQHTIVGDGTLYRWYGGSAAVRSWPSDSDRAPDLAQRIPTYQDVLDLPRERIMDADYVSQDGVTCVYVETYVDELGYLERFWVSVDSGLLVAAETSKEDRVVLRMRSSAVNALALEEMDFSLPDGTLLHVAESAG